MDNSGWRFPVESDRIYGNIKMTSYEEMIRQSIRMIITTRKGTRFLHPEFGCNIYNFLFSTIDYTTLKQIENEIVESINAWEKRITDLEVRASADKNAPNCVVIEISYYVPELNASLRQSHKFSV